MANYTRSHGANARSQDWEDFEEDQGAQRTGSWLPLETLKDEVYFPGPALRAMPATARPGRAQPDVAQPIPAAQPARVPKQKREARSQTGTAGVPARFVAILGAGALAALAVYVAVSAAVEWTSIKLDDLQYGRPRTAQLDAFVGHGEADGVPTHFIAMNLSRRVTVIELPGGDGSKATTIIGPYLFGANEDLTPVQASAQDVNGDGKPDLVVSAKNEQLIYLNDGAAFKLITQEQQATLRKAQATSPAAPATGDGATQGTHK
jgi:hypothetical protein